MLEWIIINRLNIFTTCKKNAIQDLKNQLNFILDNFKSPIILDFTVDHFISTYVGRYGIDNWAEFSEIYETKVIDPQREIYIDC